MNFFIPKSPETKISLLNKKIASAQVEIERLRAEIAEIERLKAESKIARGGMAVYNLIKKQPVIETTKISSNEKRSDQEILDALLSEVSGSSIENINPEDILKDAKSYEKAIIAEINSTKKEDLVVGKEKTKYGKTNDDYIRAKYQRYAKISELQLKMSAWQRELYLLNIKSSGEYGGKSR